MSKIKKPKHIAVAGNIGAGKTTLTQMLSKHYKWTPQYEDVDHNPYLMDFYEDMPRWSFNLQIYFLNKRLNQLLTIQRGNETVIQDRTIYEDATIFAPNLHDMGLMLKRDFENYESGGHTSVLNQQLNELLGIAELHNNIREYIKKNKKHIHCNI
ncbi:MAG: deoxynucleoside kinase, partial [Bacteroidota bacterium]|nr:deoxynucleoside kinase [Bacteroidota bacterium]